EYNQQLVDACLEAQVEVVGIADHGSVKELDKLRNLFIQNGIVVFPGFEIASSEKVHFVCLFGEDKTSQELERILGRLSKLDPAEGILPTELSAVQLIDAVEEIGGFVFAAHSTTASGVLKSKMNHIWKYPKLRAAQIPANLSDLKGGELDFYRDVFLNKNTEYRRERPMA
ncbi:PHP domain-containing protein, partial [Klebsiella pneumoniae]